VSADRRTNSLSAVDSIWLGLLQVPAESYGAIKHLVDLLPDVGDGFRALRCCPSVQPVHVLDGAQDIVVIDGFAVFSRLHHGADKDRRDVVGVVPWSSSHCTIRRLLLFFAQVAYAIRLFVASCLLAGWFRRACHHPDWKLPRNVGNFLAKLVGSW